MPSREEIYDTEIAPKLLELGKLCEARGMPFYAEVWFDGDGSGRTAFHPEGPRCWPWQLVRAAGQAKGNLDALVFAVARAVPDGGGSAVLRMLMTEPR